MKFNAVHERTTVIPVDNQLVQVSDLPQEVRNEVTTLDRLLQDKLDAIYRLETIELAAVVKSQQVHALVSQLVKKAKDDQEATQQKAANDAAVQQELSKLSDEKPKPRAKKS
jgi:DNA repair protein RadC